MATNYKTWDMPGLNHRSPVMNPSGLSNANNFVQGLPYSGSTMLNTPLGRVQAAPALPPRPARNTPVMNNYNPYNSFSSPYNSFGYGGYSSGYGGYGGGYSGYGYGLGGLRSAFGSYGYGSPGYPNSAYPENRFIQVAEESSRPAFQSIQSVLQALSSVTMMFESTFHAIHSSYMSVLGVADNFGRLRSLFGQVFSMFAVIRTLNWMFKKLLYLIGIRKENPMSDEIWSNALNEAAGLTNAEQQKGHKRPTWALMMFLSVIVAGPYLLFKLISQLNPVTDIEIWNPAEHPGSLAVGIFDFSAGSDQELSFSAQQKLMIAPKEFQPTDCPGWLLACNETRRVGLIPHNYVGNIMQSEKTGLTYIDHNGRTYAGPTRNTESRLDGMTEATIPSNVRTVPVDLSNITGVVRPEGTKETKLNIEESSSEVQTE